jgi:cardiolipin synthase/putative cardiolipin synthase
MNELASYFKSKDAIVELKKKLDNLFDGKKLLFGKDLLETVSQVSEESLSEPVIELLMENEVLIKAKAGTEIQSYLFGYNIKKAQKYFLKQADAAEVIETAFIPRLEKDNEFKVLVTIPDDSHFRKQDDIPLLYPAIKKLIQKSRKTIDIVNPFFDVFGTKKIIPDLLTAARRDVSIRIITRGLFDIEDGNNNRESWRIILDAFRKHGIESKIGIRDYFKRDEKSFRHIFAVHSKMLISDDEECYIGSANITTTSLYSNFETGILFNGMEVKKAKNLFNSLWQASKPAEGCL